MKWFELPKGDVPSGEPVVGNVRHRVEVCCRWGTFEVCVMHRHVHVSCWAARFVQWLWSVYVALPKAFRLSGSFGRCEAMKYVKAVVAAAKKAGPGDMKADAELHSHRPALQEFMTAVGNPKEGFREVSPVMLCCDETGVRAGLKDDEAGGWCWRRGNTLTDALDALEKALQEGTAIFGGMKGKKGKKG